MSSEQTPEPLHTPRSAWAFGAFGLAIGLGSTLMPDRFAIAIITVCYICFVAMLYLCRDEFGAIYGAVVQRHHWDELPKDFWFVLLMAAAVFAVATYLLTNFSSPPPSAGTPSNLVRAETTSTQGKVFIDCSGASPTVTIPPSGSVKVLEIQPIHSMDSEPAPSFLSDVFAPIGSQTKIAETIVYRCEVTNYLSVPIFAVELPTHFTFVEAVVDPQQPNTRRSGRIVKSYNAILHISKIDFGTSSAFVYYVSSHSPHFVEVTFLSGMASFTTEPNGHRNKAPFFFPAGLVMHLYPKF